jgi:hypothetical protein
MTAPRVGIFTYHYSENVGALMQAYGLREWLRNQGVDADFVNYHPDYVEGGGSLRNLFAPRNFKSNLKVAFLKLTNFKRALFEDKSQLEQIRRFQREKLGVIGPVLKSYAEVNAFLTTPAGRFDALICGSDQIWSPSVQFGIDPVYYLHFGDGAQGAKIISYAPSFGRAELDSKYDAKAREYLAGFDSLSVREPSGGAIVERLTGRLSAVVADPAVLLGDFTSLLHDLTEPVSNGHVFCYALRSGDGVREVSALASRSLGREILSPYNPHRRWTEIGKTIKPSPSGWVANLANSGFVVTNSFHGTVFSILFRKPFITVGLPGKRAGLNERSKNLLASLGLAHRFIDAANAVDAEEVINAPIDWSAVEPRLIEMQNSGRLFLENELGKLNDERLRAV